MRYRRPRADRHTPEALGECARGGGHLVRRSELMPQMAYGPAGLMPTGLLVCRRHLDVPNPQDQPRILPGPDPAPVHDPRPPTPMTPLPGLLTDGVVTPGVQAGQVLTDSKGRPLTDGTGAYQAAEHYPN